MASYVSCSKTDHDKRQAWMAQHGLRLSPRRRTWAAFVAGAGRSSNIRPGEWEDHGEVWIRAERSRGFRMPAAYTAQPYDLPNTDRDEIEQIAENHGFRVEVLPKSESWYYPGETWLIVFWAPRKWDAP